MSPEQANRESVDPRTDVFAFGALLYEMLAGIRAFRAANELAVIAAVIRSEPRALTQIVPDVPPSVDAIVTRCLKKARAERFADGKELSAALESFGRPLSTGPFQAYEHSRISSPDLAAPTIQTPIETTPSNASVTTTKKPIDLRDRRTQKLVAIGAGALLFFVVVLAFALSGPSAPPPTASATTGTPLAASADPIMIPPPPPPAFESAAPVADEEPAPPPASASQVTAPIPVRTAKPAAKGKPADCKTPFIIDSKGVKIPKMHCLQ
jgi:serine/threonine protein kinase